MPLSPLDITQQRFRVRFGGGLDKAEVDTFLQTVAQELERLVREQVELREEARSHKRMLDEYRSREEALKETMITAQRVTEEIKRSAEKEADIIIGRAELAAERIQEQAVARRAELLSDIAELKRQRVELVARLRGVVNTHQKLLDVVEQEDTNDLAVLKKKPAPVAQIQRHDDDSSRARG